MNLKSRWSLNNGTASHHHFGHHLLQHVYWWSVISKSIETLIPDIYALISDPKGFSDENVRQFGQALAERLSYRLSETRGAGTLRVSNLGKPDRQLWYEVHSSSDREPLPPAARLKFLFGDVLEELLLFLAREAGHDVRCEQAEVDIEGVKGHIDAIIDGRLTDVKSASTFAIQKFANHGLQGDDPFGYLDQIGGYAFGLKDHPDLKERDVASFLAVDKTLGNLVLDTYYVGTKDYAGVVAQKRDMLASVDPPARCFPDELVETKNYKTGKVTSNGNRKLGLQCSYCPFKFKCWADANDGKGLRQFNYKQGNSIKPIFLTKVVSEPRVAEASSS